MSTVASHSPLNNEYLGNRRPIALSFTR